jgi:hypothetical protein
MDRAGLDALATCRLDGLLVAEQVNEMGLAS